MKIFAAVLLGIASVIYPFLWYFGRNADGGFLWLAIFMASLWDNDWDYGYEYYCNEYNNLTKEEYMNILAFVQKNHKDE